MYKPRKAESGKTRRGRSPHRLHADRAMPSILDPIEPEEVRENIEEAVEQVVERVAEPIDSPHGHRPDDDEVPEEDRDEIARAAESIPADIPADRADHSEVREEHPPVSPGVEDEPDKGLIPVPARGRRHPRKPGTR